jgi:hypothetical protein
MRGKKIMAGIGGALVGGFVLMWPVGYVGMLIDARTDPDEMFAGLMGAIYGGAVGIVLGAVIGVWIALRIMKRRDNARSFPDAYNQDQALDHARRRHA